MTVVDLHNLLIHFKCPTLNNINLASYIGHILALSYFGHECQIFITSRMQVPRWYFTLNSLNDTYYIIITVIIL